MFILKRNITGHSSPARDYEKRCKVTIYLSDNQTKSSFFTKRTPYTEYRTRLEEQTLLTTNKR